MGEPARFLATADLHRWRHRGRGGGHPCRFTHRPEAGRPHLADAVPRTCRVVSREHCFRRTNSPCPGRRGLAAGRPGTRHRGARQPCTASGSSSVALSPAGAAAPQEAGQPATPTYRRELAGSLAANRSAAARSEAPTARRQQLADADAVAVIRQLDAAAPTGRASRLAVQQRLGCGGSKAARLAELARRPAAVPAS